MGPMQSTVTGKNQVTIPASIARALGIRTGAKLDWEITKDPELLHVRVIPDPARLARELCGAFRDSVPPGTDPIADFVADRVREDPG